MIFISYKAEEVNLMLDVRRELTEYGYECWSAVPDILGGGNYQTEIPKAIRKADALLVLVSELAQTSKWIPSEISLAINLGKLVIAINMDGCALNDAFDFTFQCNQIIWGKGRMQDAILELIRSLESKGIHPENARPVKPDDVQKKEEVPPPPEPEDEPRAKIWQMTSKRRWSGVRKEYGIDTGCELFLKGGQKLLLGELVAVYETVKLDKSILLGFFSCTPPYLTCYICPSLSADGKERGGEKLLYDSSGRCVGSVIPDSPISAAEWLGAKIPELKAGDVVYGKDGHEYWLEEFRRHTPEARGLFRIADNAYCHILSGESRDLAILCIEEMISAADEPVTDADGNWIGYIHRKPAPAAPDKEEKPSQEKPSPPPAPQKHPLSTPSRIKLLVLAVLMLAVIGLAVALELRDADAARTGFEVFGVHVIDPTLVYDQPSLDAHQIDLDVEPLISRIEPQELREQLEHPDWLQCTVGEETGYIHISNLETILTEGTGESTVQYDYQELSMLSFVHAKHGTPLYRIADGETTPTIFHEGLPGDYYLEHEDIYLDTPEGEVFLKIQWGDEITFVREEDIDYLYILN